MNNMAICNYIVGSVGIIVGGMIMKASAEFPLAFTENGPGSGFWPFSLGIVLLLMAVFLLLYTFFYKTDLSSEYVTLTTAANKRVYLMMGLITGYCILLSFLGFYLASAILIAAIMYLMDYHNNKVIVLTVVFTLVFIYLIFGQLLHTQMPSSIFLD